MPRDRTTSVEQKTNRLPKVKGGFSEMPIDYYLATGPAILAGFLLIPTACVVIGLIVLAVCKRRMRRNYAPTEVVNEFFRECRLFFGMIILGISLLVFAIFEGFVRPYYGTSYHVIGPSSVGFLILVVGIHCLRRDYKQFRVAHSGDANNGQ